MSVILLYCTLLATGSACGAGLMYHFLRQRSPEAVTETNATRPVFLFEDDQLIDATVDAQQMMTPFCHLPDRDAVLAALGLHFPLLADYLQIGERQPCRIAHASNDDLWLDLDWPQEHLRLTVNGAATTVTSDLQHAELTALRDIANLAPQLVWRTDSAGAVSWANRAYLDLWARLHPQRTSPLARKTIFPTFSSKTTTGSHSIRRLAVTLPQNGAEHWFDVASTKHGRHVLHYAADANAAVSADQERRNFVQVLGKTFAELSIGLAIFDKRRQLASFNPALLDLTRLGFEFLSARPTIDNMLDRLRETRILPEPKNYGSWRDQFTALENAARNGTYTEVWNLPDGQAFRVTGRPHPDGAFALLFEDITADLSLTRRFRSDIETGQAVLDALPDAVAVFSTAGTLVMYNRAYSALWGLRGAEGIEARVIGTETAIWQSRCMPSIDWMDMQHFVHQIGPRQGRSEDVILTDGRLVQCHATPIAGGMTMVRFVLAARNLPILRKLTQPDQTIRAITG